MLKLSKDESVGLVILIFSLLFFILGFFIKLLPFIGIILGIFAIFAVRQKKYDSTRRTLILIAGVIAIILNLILVSVVIIDIIHKVTALNSGSFCSTDLNHTC